jgi:hypothetical protein
MYLKTEMKLDSPQIRQKWEFWYYLGLAQEFLTVKMDDRPIARQNHSHKA